MYKERRAYLRQLENKYARQSELLAAAERRIAEQNDLRLGVTSILLEGSKQVDDWKQMLLAFPNPDTPLEPKADMFARMNDVALGVLEIKLLSQIDGDTTPRSLVASLGLPLFEVYQVLIRLSKEGILAAGGGEESLMALGGGEEEASVQDSMREAFKALDANDDAEQRRSAIDRVFGDEQEEAGNPLSALDKVLGGASPAAKPKGWPAAAPATPPAPKDMRSELDRELLDILRKTKG